MGPGCVPCLRTLWVGSSEAALGAQRPVSRPAPGGGPAFFGRKPGERTPGLRPGPGFLWPLVPTRWVWGSLSLKRSRGYFLRDAKTDLGRIFRGKICWKAFWGKKVSNPLCLHPPPKAVPLGGRWAGEAGSDEGAIDWPNGAGEGRHRGDRSLLLQGKVGYRIAPSSVTLGDSFPPRGSLRRCYTPATQFILARPLLPQNANPNQGTYMGTVIAPLPEQCATTAKTSEWQRAGPKKGGRGPSPATLCVRAFSRESLDPRPGPGGNPRRRSGPATVPEGTTYRPRQRPPAPPASPLDAGPESPLTNVS